MIKPTILLVGEAWHTADYLQPLATALAAADYPTLTLALPSVDASPAKLDFGDDVALVRYKAVDLATDGKDIIAVLHSFGGIVGTEALQGLGKPVMKGIGAVLGLVYLAAILPKKGDSFEAHLESLGDRSWKPERQVLTQAGVTLLPINTLIADGILSYRTG